MAGFLLLVPLAVIILSLWSLKVAFTAVQDSIGVISMMPDTTVKSQPVSKPTLPAVYGSNSSQESVLSDEPASPAETQGKNLSREEADLVPLSSPDTGRGSKGPSASKGSAGEKKRKVHQTVMYHVGRSFKIMTILLTSFWILALFFIVTFLPFPVYSVSVVALLCALATAVEAGFDWLITVNRAGAKEVIRRKITSSKAAFMSNKTVRHSAVVATEASSSEMTVV
ncbi:hypothetical protein BCR44DRAFT_1444852 [Catenaria anguillulae PL171]|uniref:Uncharacterized protein n=1 Tax=Catenaria anguillulae PL171 TaxID=765915 RepID=A0A1Y2H788_9FUNG|nr:hypothetical protein BCR44DRAFT_1444852 [Catenaria anguillulae PL171]